MGMMKISAIIAFSMILATGAFAQTWKLYQGSTRDDYVVEYDEKRARQIELRKAEELKAKIIEKRARQIELRKAEELKAKIIFDNCIIDLLPTDHSRPVLAAVTAKCRRISKDPTMFQKWKYSD
jgi:hypothetical protein